MPRSATDDFALALGLTSAVVLLEAALYFPRWDLLLAGAGRPGAKPGAVGLDLRTGQVEQLLSADSLAAMLVLQQACFVAAQVVRGRGGSSSAGAAAGAPTDVGLVLVRETAKELLQRGLIFTFLAAWLTDRAFEAGADDTLLLPPLAAALAALTGGGAIGGAAAGGGEVYLTDAVRLATAALMTATLAPPVFNEAEALRLGVASNLALVSVEAAARAEEQAEHERRRSASAGAVAAGAGAATGGAARTAAAEAGAGMTAIPGLALGPTTDAAGEESGGYDEGRDDVETDALLREYRLIEALGRCTSTGPPRLTYGLTLLRGLLRFGSVNLVFALTGNLAATLFASALPNLLLLAYVRTGPKVLLERPAPAAGPGGGGGDAGSGPAAGADGTGRQSDQR
ncbi:hypothetical protein GPECTOR_83g287 [Gonium pectorale]|uniref:Uncharacterized protein n=1 Tax=Gonium pectorale TaxID=33097 RepID=A0A150G2E0_GONPE|nr:hypothetical protein GPECTOR_83g287 [Gonium pectorale]|eukprot:KXZ43675.1 hypothetical protein GPECTOR_83g287 [Gonium pectorale]